MFKSLFKAAWKSDSAEKRLAFISDVDVNSSANQTILENLATNDVDTAVRHAAIAKMTDPQALYKLCQSESANDKTDTEQVAESAFRQLIQSDSVTESDIKHLIKHNPSASALVAKYCRYEETRQDILLSLDEVQQANIISEVAYSKTRVMLAEKLHTLECLEVARKNLKGKDKNAEKIIRAKIDSIHETQKREQENASLVIDIREKMEGLARYVAWSDEIKVKFFELSNTWDNLDFEPKADEKERYKTAFAQVESDVKQHIAVALAHQNQEKIANKLESITTTIAAYSLGELLNKSIEINNEFSGLKEQWHAESKVAAQTSNANERFIKASKAIEAVMAMSQCVSDSREVKSKDSKDSQETSANDKDHAFMINHHAKAILQKCKALQWPNDLPELQSKSEAIAEANAILNETKAARKEAKDALDKLHKKINRLFGTAKRGEIARANRELNSIVKAAENYDGFDKVKLDERIEEATETVRKMGDWKDFAIEPKLLELCEKMEALPELERQSKNPSANSLAKKIKDLQAQWKAMGSSDISESYWPRFKQAGDIAYEPCAEFFAKRKEIQRDNLEKREPFIQQMNEVFENTDWKAKPDYKSIEDRISQIMQGWKQIKDVEHGRGQKQWDKLSKIKAQINEKLDIEYDKNIKAKHLLIEQLKQMAELEVNDQTLDKLKFTQSKWKQIGVTRRKQDQKAWDAFKIASDAVYAKIQGIRQEKRAVEDEQIDAYKTIHKQIHQLAKSTEDLSVSDKEFEALTLQYKDLPALPASLPEKLIERIATDYNRACDAYAGAKDRLNKAKLDNELEVLANKAKLCSELEQLPEETDDTIIAELKGKIDVLEVSNKDYIKRFAKRLKKARETNREAFGEARRLMLIDCEILLDVESPKEDKDLRLQIQLDRMKTDGLGNAATNTTAALAEMKLEWLCMPGAEAKLQQAFDERFEALFKK